MTTQLVGVFLNLDLRDKYFGYKPEHPLVFCGDLLVEAGDEFFACGAAWNWAQRADGMNATEGVRPVGQHATPTGDLWLDDRQMPSLSVGDVFLVGLGEGEQRHDTCTWIATASFGFDTIAAPDKALVAWHTPIREALNAAMERDT